jgi:hypothetical protein
MATDQIAEGDSEPACGPSVTSALYLLCAYEQTCELPAAVSFGKFGRSPTIALVEIELECRQQGATGCQELGSTIPGELSIGGASSASSDGVTELLMSAECRNDPSMT